MRLIYICILFLFVNTAYAQEQKTIKIGAGSLLQGYYNIGIKLCRYISNSNENTRCEVVPTNGSVENLSLLKEGKIDFAFTLSNLAIDSYNGSGYFDGHKPFKEMYQILRLHDEVFTVIVKDDDKILVFSDLDDKKISNGPPNSDSSVLYNELESYYDFKKAPTDIEIFHEDYAKEFCSGKIDAIMLMTGHPSALVNLISHSCEVDFVTIEKDKIKKLLEENPGFHEFTLKSGSYPGITRDEKTVAVSSIFVAGPSADKEIVNNFIEYFNKKTLWFKSSSPLFFDLEDEYFTTEFVLPKIDNSINKQRPR